MPTNRTTSLAGLLCRVLSPPDGVGMTDGQLLDRFVADRDEAAFRALVRQHGPMVWGVCRRLLRSQHDAEDAFQATFLVLVRRAKSIVPSAMVANWLFGVARRTALRTLATTIRRDKREQLVADIPEVAGSGHDNWSDLQSILDRELSRLPDNYRMAIILCDLEGMSRKESARRLGTPEGTLSGWLTRGRSLLAKRLSRHGLTLSGGALAGLVSQHVAAARVPVGILSSTLRYSALAASGQMASGLISCNVVAISEGVMKAMLVSKLKVLAVALIAVAALGVGTGGLNHLARGEGQPGSTKEPPKASPIGLRDTAADLEAAQTALKQAEANLAATRARVAEKEAAFRQARARTDQTESGAGPSSLAAALASRFKYRVPFEIGETEKSDGGWIEILEVWGTRPKIEVGGQYLVRGKYALSSQQRGKLYFYLTASDWNNTGPNLDLQSVDVAKGSGEFMLVHGMGGPGSFHLQLAGGDAGKYGTIANVYFGTGDNVWRKK